jgi:hypothetical protein
MGRFVLFAEHRSQGQGGAPSAASIEAALMGIPVVANRRDREAQGLLDDGTFVGSARITRVATFSLTSPDRITRVAWLYEYAPGGPTFTVAQQAGRDAAIRDYIRSAAEVALRNVGSSSPIIGDTAVVGGEGWQPVQILPYNESVNGSYDWWRCSQLPLSATRCAAATRTRDSFDLNQQTGTRDTAENPTGPSLAVPLPNFDPIGTNNPNGAVAQIGSGLRSLAWIVGIGAALYTVGPLLRLGATSAAGAGRELVAARRRRRRAR